MKCVLGSVLLIGAFCLPRFGSLLLRRCSVGLSVRTVAGSSGLWAVLARRCALRSGAWTWVKSLLPRSFRGAAFRNPPLIIVFRREGGDPFGVPNYLDLILLYPQLFRTRATP